MSNLVSIIMPAYNVSEYISHSIKSVLKQSFNNWELIIVDDCSSDGTKAVIETFLADRRIKLIENEVNLGGAGSRNVAIRSAKGRYIAFLDSDDVWVSTKLKKQVDFMEKNGFGFTFSAHTLINEQGNEIETVDVPKKVNFRKLLRHNYIGCLTAMYDTEPYGKVYMPTVKKRQDFALWLELLKKFDYAYSIQESLGFYRVRSGSLSRSKKDALKYYWKVLRDVANCNLLSASFYLSSYLMIVYFKKKHLNFYNKFFIG